MSIFSACHLIWCDLCQRPTDLLDVFLNTSLAIIIQRSGRKVDQYSLLLTFNFILVGTVVGHFAGLAASILVGDWLVSFITSQVSWI